MFKWTKLSVALAATLAVLGACGAAQADGSIKDTPSDDGRKFSWSASLSGTSEYVFRGISASYEDPTVQGWLTMNYGILYGTIWASGADLGEDALARAILEQEIDYNLGIRPTWGPVTFDFALLYYTFPGAKDDGLGGVNELDFLELKAGASISPAKNLALGAVAYYAPDFLGETGPVWTFEGTAAYTLPEVGPFTPTISGLLGTAIADEVGAVVPGGTQYTYWNAGLSLTVQKITFDFRYWDTDVDLDTYDERFVFSTTVTLP